MKGINKNTESLNLTVNGVNYELRKQFNTVIDNGLGGQAPWLRTKTAQRITGVLFLNNKELTKLPSCGYSIENATELIEIFI